VPIDELLNARAERATVAARLESVKGELGETLRYELSTLPPEGWREDLAEVIRDLRSDLDVGSARVLERFEQLRKQIFVRRRARARVTASPANADVAAKLLETFLSQLPEGNVERTRLQPHSSIHARLEQRYGHLSRPVHFGFVRPGAKSGTYVAIARGPSYASRSREQALDFLAVDAFTGRAPHGFVRVGRAGLAYGSWLVLYPATGRIMSYVDRCPDVTQTIRFVGTIASTHGLDGRSLLDYGLANAFSDFRGGSPFSLRGADLAADLADGITPEQVSEFKRLLLKTASEKDSPARIQERLPVALGPVTGGYGRKVSESPGAVALVIGSEDTLTRYEAFLKERGEADRLIRLYPRDFWPLPVGERSLRESATDATSHKKAGQPAGEASSRVRQ
jgi:hypothetical protein